MGLYGRSLAKRAIQLSPQEPGAGAIVDFVRCSYLGLDNHPSIVRGAVDAITDYGSLHWSCARTRLSFALLRDLEAEIPQPLRARLVAFPPGLLAHLGTLPLTAPGHLTVDARPVVAFAGPAHAPLALTHPAGAAG